ncbi:hypothetical protein MP228_007609 [Amoeboaphelidium protococcarum]|nr:hypothetical protein MP228_007609 [Amoeboaphelidium protococcarum]
MILLVIIMMYLSLNDAMVQFQDRCINTDQVNGIASAFKDKTSMDYLLQVGSDFAQKIHNQNDKNPGFTSEFVADISMNAPDKLNYALHSLVTFVATEDIDHVDASLIQQLFCSMFGIKVSYKNSIVISDQFQKFQTELAGNRKHQNEVGSLKPTLVADVSLHKRSLWDNVETLRVFFGSLEILIGYCFYTSLSDYYRSLEQLLDPVPGMYQLVGAGLMLSGSAMMLQYNKVAGLVLYLTMIYLVFYYRFVQVYNSNAGRDLNYQ